MYDVGVRSNKEYLEHINSSEYEKLKSQKQSIVS